MADASIPPKDRSKRVPLPPGYRQGVISAITLLLGFSLVFLRYWSFEAGGQWNIPSAVAAALIVLAIILELISLWRSLQPQDDDEATYRITLRWFLASIVALSSGVLLAALAYSHAFNL